MGWWGIVHPIGFLGWWGRERVSKGGDTQVSPKAEGERILWSSGPRPQEEEVLMTFWLNAIRGEGMTNVFGPGPQGGKGRNVAGTMGP